MFGSKRARRRQARRQAERVMADARMAAEAARRSLKESRAASGGRPPKDEEIADAVQAAMLGSLLPGMGDPRVRKGGSGNLLALLVGMGIGVGIAAWARHEDPRQPGTEDDEWELAGDSSLRAVKSTINESLDKADVALRRAAGVTAQAMGSAVGSFAEAAGPTAEIVTGKLRTARERATREVISALDGVEDVWGDESDDDPAPPEKKAKRPVPRKPVVGKPPVVKSSTGSKPGSSRRSAPKP